MRNAVAAALATLLLPVCAARADDANKLTLAREILGVTHVIEKVRRLLPALVPAIRQGLSAEAVDPTEIDRTIQRVEAPTQEDTDHLVQELSAFYARELSEDDLSNILAFYQTPSGRDLLVKENEIGNAITVTRPSLPFLRSMPAPPS